jgi:hypothetical protein
MFGLVRLGNLGGFLLMPLKPAHPKGANAAAALSNPQWTFDT